MWQHAQSASLPICSFLDQPVVEAVQKLFLKADRLPVSMLHGNLSHVAAWNHVAQVEMVDLDRGRKILDIEVDLFLLVHVLLQHHCRECLLSRCDRCHSYHMMMPLLRLF